MAAAALLAFTIFVGIFVWTPPNFWALALGAFTLLSSLRVYYNRTGPKADRCAKQLFGFSIRYLFLLFAEIAGERLLAILPLNVPWGCLDDEWPIEIQASPLIYINTLCIGKLVRHGSSYRHLLEARMTKGWL